MNPLLDMLSASIWQEDRVGSRDGPGAVGGLARVEVGPVVVVVHTVLVVVRMRLLLERGIIAMYTNTSGSNERPSFGKACV